MAKAACRERAEKSCAQEEMTAMQKIMKMMRIVAGADYSVLLLSYSEAVSVD